MSAPIISVENLSKRYLIGRQSERGELYFYTTLRDALWRELRTSARNTVELLRGRQIVHGDTVEHFWALKDVSFEVNDGEVLGIIGRNGAGKSTLLKVLSRITEPTTGRVTLRGRVASLLEVGTGFHPELSGRENIYLNGAILGMSRAEIRRKFDEIVGFAEIDKFLDTPVKRYSSGMYVRLAFAVAAHLEPEILIIDEVLAVGDAVFQKKCLGKMSEVSRREGRTVLFVSHDMAAIAELADRAVLLERGSITAAGAVSNVLSSYLSKGAEHAIYASPYDETYEHPHVARVEVRTSEPNGIQNYGEPLEIEVWVRHPRPIEACLGVQIVNQAHYPALDVYAYPPDRRFGGEPGSTLIRFHFPKIRLSVGEFYLRTWLSEPPGQDSYEELDGICRFEVVRRDRAPLWGWRPGVCTFYDDFSSEIAGVTSDLSVPRGTRVSGFGLPRQ
jgi:ABC-type polysaccharide/polyol phosphate transport system ATPase subunit